MQRRIIGLLIAAILLPAIPAISHHSNSAYEVEKVVTLTGVVKEWKWSNPHTWLYLTVDDGKCQTAGVGITGVAHKAYRARGVEQALKGAAVRTGSLTAAAAHAADGVAANSDLFASPDYRKHLAQVYARRALEAAASRTK